MASKRKECSIENYFKKNKQQVQENVIAVASNYEYFWPRIL